MRAKIHILGSGGLASEVTLYLLAMGYEPGRMIGQGDRQVKGWYAVGIGIPHVKKRAIECCKSGVKWMTVYHRSACVLLDAGITYGDGCVFAPGAVLTTNIKIGNFVLFNLNCTVGHDARIGDYCSIMPGAAVGGNCTLGSCVMVGANAAILPGVKIGDRATVGAGAVVLRDVPAGHTIVGNPGRSICALS